VLGHGLVTAEGAHWKQQRALLSPAFHFGALQRMQPLFEAAAARLV
jgi:cytochrome P450